MKQAFTFPVEFVEVENDRKLCEVNGFIEALSEFETDDPNEILFYAHTKGTGFSKPTNVKNIRDWRNVMYRECLRDVDLVDYALERYSCAGCFRVIDVSIGKSMMGNDYWHFSGTFWWVNLRDLFIVDGWDKLPNTKQFFERHAVEFYLGSKFKLERSYCFAYDDPKSTRYSFIDNQDFVTVEPNPEPYVLKVVSTNAKLDSKPTRVQVSNHKIQSKKSNRKLGRFHRTISRVG